MFEQLVLRSEILTIDEFFSSIETIRSKLKSLNFEPEIVDRLVGFREFEKIRFEDKDVVMFARSDKEALLESFNELKELFDKNLFGIFADRLDEEVTFWDNFMKKLKDDGCYLYGNSLDGKIECTNKPTFVQTKYEDEDDTIETEKFDNNFQDVAVSFKNEKYVKVGNTDVLGLIQKINNQSTTILHRGINHQNKSILKSANKIEMDFSEFELLEEKNKNNSKSSKKMTRNAFLKEQSNLKASSNKKHGQNSSIDISEQEFFNEYKKQIACIQKNMQIKLNSGGLQYFFGTEKSSIIIKAINANRSENLSLHDPKNIYVEGDYDKLFDDKYRELNESSGFLLKKAFSLFPINNENEWRMREKVIVDLKGLCQKVENFRIEISKMMKDEEAIRHQMPVNFLISTLMKSINRLASASQ